MKSLPGRSRGAAAVLVSFAAVAATLIAAGPVWALSFPARLPGHGSSTPAQGAGSGMSVWSLAVVAAIVATTIAFGVIGWRYDRRRVQRSEQATSGPGEQAAPAGRPSAAKPLPTRAAAGVHAHRRDERRHQSQM